VLFVSAVAEQVEVDTVLVVAAAVLGGKITLPLLEASHTQL
jgi:hypothetical protein